MTPFDMVLAFAMVIMALVLVAGLIYALCTPDELSRAVVADLVFYAMVVSYLVWTLNHPTSIDYEIALLSALIVGVLPTFGMSRIISQGRR